jgi:hypothetical protein
VFFLHRLKESGYPFAQDDLSMDEWIAIYEMKILLETPRLPDGK